jgi:hypothetical protein
MFQTEASNQFVWYDIPPPYHKNGAHKHLTTIYVQISFIVFPPPDQKKGFTGAAPMKPFESPLTFSLIVNATPNGITTKGKAKGEEQVEGQAVKTHHKET